MLKTEQDGRMFPDTDDSATITACLLNAAHRAGVIIETRSPVISARRIGEYFTVSIDSRKERRSRCLLVASGGMRSRSDRGIAESFGHAIVEPVPSLFSLHAGDACLAGLAGLSIADAAIRVHGSKNLQERGPLLITHRGLSGPAILKLSSLGARLLAQRDYRFELTVDWVPVLPPAQLDVLFAAQRSQQPRRRVSSCTITALPRRLWERLVASAGIPSGRTWSELRRDESRALVDGLKSTRLEIAGRSLNKEEFVTCGGVPLDEVDMQRMESRLVSNLFFAGEVLDIDGLTGGFNLQAAWTEGWIAATAIAARLA
jgi:predicted Rossmann fold flavoprotein